MATAHVEERELLQAMTWYDGFVVALANPSFLLTSLGAPCSSLGGWGAIIVWSISVIIGALHNNIYAEVAAMFPKLSGGVAVYAHEAWKRYTSFVGPIAAVGYWLGWSVVLSLNAVIVGGLLHGEFWPDATFGHDAQGARSSASTSTPARRSWSAPSSILGIWAANVFGVRPAVWTGYVTGALPAGPARRRSSSCPTSRATSSSANLHNFIDWGSRPAPPAGSS